MAGVLLDHAQGRACIADAGYDAEHIRSAIRLRKMKAVIPSNPTRAIIRRYDKKLYRCRYLVECFFHKLKACRRIATRYEKTARNYLALIHLACALQWIDAQTSGRRTIWLNRKLEPGVSEARPAGGRSDSEGA
jgi:transposase